MFGGVGVVCSGLWGCFLINIYIICVYVYLLVLFSSDSGHLAGELCVRLSPVCCPGLNLAVREAQRQNKDIARLIISRACESLPL